MATQRTRQSMKTDQSAKNDVVTTEQLESFDDILAEALGELGSEGSLQTEEFGEEGDVSIDAGDEGDLGDGDFQDEGGGGSIEDLVEQLRDIVEQIAAEVGVGGDEDESDYDDDFQDDTLDDDMTDIPTEAKGSKGHPIKGRGKNLQAKNNKVPSKPHTNTGKPTKTAVQGRHGQVGNAPKSNLHDKGKQKVGGTKTTVNDDLF